MSINTILNYRSSELMSSRKLASDIKNDTEDLNFTITKIGSAHGRFAKKVRNYNDDKELAGLISGDDEWSHCKDIH